MKKIHTYLGQKMSWYQEYHLMPYHSALHFLLLTVFILGAGLGIFGNLQTANAAVCNSTTTIPCVNVLYPNGGEVFTANQLVTVTWNSFNVPATHTMKIALSLQGSAISQTLVTSAGVSTFSNTGSATIVMRDPMTIGSWSGTASYGQHYKIAVVDTASTSVWDMSDNLFTINPNTPTLVVTSPNGGQFYNPGQQVNVTWNSFNIPAAATVAITIDKVQTGTAVGSWPISTYTVTSSTPNDGNESITLPNSTSFVGGMSNIAYDVGMRYKIHISYTPTAGSVIQDYSDNYFMISNACPILTGSSWIDCFIFERNWSVTNLIVHPNTTQVKIGSYKLINPSTTANPYNFAVTKLRFTVSKQNPLLTDITNVKLYANGLQIGSTVATGTLVPNYPYYIQFVTLLPTNLILTQGQIKTVDVYADISPTLAVGSGFSTFMYENVSEITPPNTIYNNDGGSGPYGQYVFVQ